MDQIEIRPELKNAGGEASDILLNEKYVGSLTLLYRENEKLHGSVQIDQSTLPKHKSTQVMEFVQRYVEGLVDALNVESCQVLVTHSRFDHIIATGYDIGTIEEISDVPYKPAPTAAKTKKSRKIAKPLVPKEDMMLVEDITELARPFRLMIAGEGRDYVEYQVFDAKHHLLAECLFRLHEGDVVGDVTWLLEPTTEEIDEVTELIVSDFDPDEVDAFTISMQYHEEELAHIELNHEDYFNPDEDEQIFEVTDPYQIELIRDDGNSLTFEIREEGSSTEKIGIATIDLSGSQISGYVDFTEPGNREDREAIASAIVREVERDRPYDTFNLSMLYHDEVIDEIVFDQREVH